MISKYYCFFLSVSVLYSCTEPVPEITKDEPPVKVAAPIKKSLPKRTPPDTHLINDSNVTKKLMEFSKANPEKKLWIYTSFGKIKVRLYEQTPLHRASFLLWTKSRFYDGSVFMRVSPNFIAQGGTTNSDRQMEIKKRIGQYTIPAEFRPGLFHKRGALAFARDYENNPQKRSDSHRFYFVEGTMYNKPTLDKYERETGRKYPKEIREYYLVQPGAAHLDYEHTVFGEVLHGMDVIAKITRVETDSREWPLKDVYIDSIRIIVKKP